MYLKYIELNGFKSFSSKTKISFEPGISCIVGPNGSGKSNITDALRWVLGENNARLMRGGKMEDVIFAGSGKRRPLGMAEVTVVLDNADGYLPMPFSEISVTRRAVRNGASEYYINGAGCRLKDIRDLVMDTGIGVDGLSLINQGRVNELISARPDERRVLVEEAAGIVKYRERKREAARKLDETQRHLERLNDIIYELSSRIEPLKEQSQKAQKYLLLKEEADNVEIGVSVRVLSEAHEQIAALQQQIDAQEQQLLEDESSRLQVASELSRLRLEIETMDETVRQANDEYYRLQNEREHAEGELKLALAQQENNNAELTRLTAELELNEQAINQRQSEAQELEDHINRTAAELAEAEQGLLFVQGDDEDIQRQAVLLNEQILQHNRQSAELFAQLSSAETSNKMKLEQKEKLQQNLQQMEKEFMQLREQREQDKEEALQQEKLAEEMKSAAKQLSAQSNTQAEKIHQLSKQAAELSVDEAECRLRYQSARTRLHMVEEMIAGYEGFFPGVKGLMVAQRKGQAPAGIIGVVAELMDVPAEYRVAVEAFLGANVQNIICESAAAAKEAVSYLKKHRLGRATFLPLDILKLRDEFDFSAVEKISGVHGRASQLVSIEQACGKALQFLLGNLLIVDNMDVALAAAKALRYRSHVVTLDGDLINPGAAISGGSRNDRAGEMLGKKIKLAEARQEAERIAWELEQRTKAVQDVHDALQQERDDNERTLAELKQLNQRVQAAQLLQEQANYRQATMTERLGVLSREQARLSDELDALDEDTVQGRADWEKLNEEYMQLQQLLEQLNEQLSQLENQLNSSRESMTARQVAMAALQQKLKGQNISLEKLHSDLTDLAWEAEDKLADLRLNEQKKAEYSTKIEQLEQMLRDIAPRIHEAGEQLEQARHGLSAESARINELDKEEKEHLRIQDKLKSELHRLQLRRERWQADFENESLKLGEKFELSLDAARLRVGEIDEHAVLIERLGKLRRQINALGNVNIDAIAEYAEVSERNEFLCAQQDDMLEAKDKLGTVIKEMDSIMVSRFKQAFEQLNNAFNSCFSRLFGGGSAGLRMTDPDSILETGVDLMVSPPGKKVSNYNLLSGGEKSLIGIALMFAMLEVRPSPFCVMDEVDAALDEANIDRFTAFLRDKSAQSQFVMISHRQTTMEAANSLWGVTMEEEGISKVVSVRLTEAS